MMSKIQDPFKILVFSISPIRCHICFQICLLGVTLNIDLHTTMIFEVQMNEKEESDLVL